jgi:hypothetical protein
VTGSYLRGDVYKVGNIMSSSGEYDINNPNTNKIQRVLGNGSDTDPILVKKN